MAIWNIVNPSFLIAGLERSNTAGAQPISSYDLALAVVAIAVWAVAVALIAAWLRAREVSAARAHIRSIRIARRDGDSALNSAQRSASEDRPKRRHWWVKPLAQM
jgi:hypothetical protein